VKPYLLAVQQNNVPAVNEALNGLYIEEEDYEGLKVSIDSHDAYDPIALASSLENHELLEFRRIGLYTLYSFDHILFFCFVCSSSVHSSSFSMMTLLKPSSLSTLMSLFAHDSLLMKKENILFVVLSSLLHVEIIANVLTTLLTASFFSQIQQQPLICTRRTIGGANRLSSRDVTASGRTPFKPPPIPSHARHARTC